MATPRVNQSPLENAYLILATNRALDKIEEIADARELDLTGTAPMLNSREVNNRVKTARLDDARTSASFISTGLAIGALSSIARTTLPETAGLVLTEVIGGIVSGGALAIGFSNIASKPRSTRTARIYDRLLREVDGRANWLLAQQQLPAISMTDWSEVSDADLHKASKVISDEQEQLIARFAETEGLTFDAEIAFEYAAKVAWTASIPSEPTQSLLL